MLLMRRVTGAIWFVVAADAADASCDGSHLVACIAARGLLLTLAG